MRAIYAGLLLLAAVALFMRSMWDRETRARDERRCGRWTLAPSIDLDPTAVRSIARSVEPTGAAR